LLLSGWSVGFATSGEAIRTYPLDERMAYSIRVSREEPTTCLFPGALTALESANLSLKPEDAPPVLLSYQPGTSFFSVRALRADATAAVNVVYRGRVYVFTFRTAPEADRAVSFFESTPATAAVATPTVARSLLDRAKNHALLAAQYPALTQAVERVEPRSLTRYPHFTVILEEVFRFDAEDTLVFRARAENPGTAPIRFDAEDLAVRVGPEIYPALLADTTGEIPSRGQTTLWFAVAGAPQGGRANLSVQNAFSVLVTGRP
jgi:hypothetical protein